jgi:protein-tyrosine phosphatase
MFIWLKNNLNQKFKRKIRRVFQATWDSAAYRLIREKSDARDPHHIVFVCKGNICRSVFAEYYLRSLVRPGLLRIESCGLDVDQGIVSPREAVRIGREFGLDLAGHCSKGLEACDLVAADLIVPMDYGQYRRLIDMYPGYRNKIRVLRDFAPWPDRLLCNIYDPFGLGETEFRHCFGVIRVALEGMGKIVACNVSNK